jgi:hypothetical protein
MLARDRGQRLGTACASTEEAIVRSAFVIAKTPSASAIRANAAELHPPLAFCRALA